MDHQAGPLSPPVGGAARITVADQFVLLRRAWFDVVSDVDPDDHALLALINERLDAFEAVGVVPGEDELLKTAEDAAQVSLASVSADQARVLSRRLRRGVYEFLLAIDAAEAATPAPAAEVPFPDAGGESGHGAMMIGLEEVTGLLYSNGGERPELAWDEPSITTRPPLESLSPADPVGEGLWTEFADAASLSIVEPPPDDKAAETTGDVDDNLPDAEAPVADRPVLHVVDNDVAAGHGAGQGLPDPGDFSEPGGDDAVRVPPSFRREPGGPPPLVVPSYRAWADVLASASDTVGGPAFAPAAAPSTSSGPTLLVGPALPGGPWLQASPGAVEPETTAPKTESSEPTDAPADAPEWGEATAATDALAEAAVVADADTETHATETAGAENADVENADVETDDAEPAHTWTAVTGDHIEPVVAGEPFTDDAASADELVAEVAPDTEVIDPGAPDAPDAPDASGAEPPGPIAEPVESPTHLWTAPLPPTSAEDVAPAPAAEAPGWAPRPDRPQQPVWPMSAGPSAATGWPGTPPAWTDEVPSAPAASGDTGVRDWPPAETQAPETEGDRGDHGGDAAGGWSVRTSPRQQLLAERMAQKRREDAVRAATEAMMTSPAAPEGRRHKKRRLDEQRISRDTVRADVEDMLRRRKGADAAALLQRAAQEMGGRDVADLALDSGDRCRALGQQRAAINCFLAAWRSDPIYETPLWRLADACLTDRSVELAVGYLERIADLMRARGDDEGAMGVYRKIVAVAPDRADIRELLRIAQISGRLAP